MKCAKCKKEITIADVPEYTQLHEVKKNTGIVYFLCKLCRQAIEPKTDVHWQDLTRQMEAELIAPNVLLWVKFTCHYCGSRQTLDQPNAFFTGGNMCEQCNKTSYPEKFGMMKMYSHQNRRKNLY